MNIKRINLNTLRSLVGTVLLVSTISFSFSAVAHADADSLYIGDGEDNTVKRFDTKNGKFLGNFIATQSGGLGKIPWLQT